MYFAVYALGTSLSVASAVLCRCPNTCQVARNYSHVAIALYSSYAGIVTVLLVAQHVLIVPLVAFSKYQS